MWSGQLRPKHTELPHHVADACLRVLGVSDEMLPDVRQSIGESLIRHAGGAELQGVR